MPDEPVNPFVIPPAPELFEIIPPEPEEPPPVEEPRPDEKASCLAKINAILAEHDGLESNVGVNHPEYWRLIKYYRSLGAS